MSVLKWWRLAVAAGALALVPGCSSAPMGSPADPDQARQALRTALDSWQRGEKPEALAGQTPPIRVVDPDWQKGRRLVRYSIEDDTIIGFELRCRVVLSIQPPGGSAVQRKATYSVGTAPALTVVRDEES